LSLVTSLLNIPVIPNDRTQILNPLTGKNLELDIWMPELKKAIEYNGEYWHSLPDRQHNDKIKVQQCKDKGIELLVIKDNEWSNNRKGCIDNIKTFIKNM